MVCAGDSPEQVHVDCSATELIRVATDAGIEPASIDPRSNPFSRHRRGYKLRSSGIVRPGLVVSYATIGRWQEVSRAFTTEDVATPGKNRARLNAVFSREKTACGVEPLRLVGLPEVSAHCATGAFRFTARGNDRDAGWVVSQTK